MNLFKIYLKQEFVRRTTKNPSYSLRAFAQYLDVNHATLSSLLSGKRTITQASAQKIARALNLSPSEVARLTSSSHEPVNTETYFLIQQDAFVAISEWYFDAILELSLIPNFNLEPEVISKSLGLSILQAKIALETLERLGLFRKGESGQYKLQNKNSINILDPDFTSAANRKYQKSVLEKSLEALEKIDRKKRDHTSTTMAINHNDLPKVKEVIQKFRRDLNAYLQRDESQPDEVYQLQISFFPLSQNLKQQESK